MTMKFDRATVLARLQKEVDEGRSIFGVGAGNGLVARCADDGGADLIIVYNSGYFRTNGLPSFVGNLPVGDANEIMLRLGRESILPARRNTPVIGGVYSIDPIHNISDVLDEVQKIGFSGVINFPSVTRYELFSMTRKELEAHGFGFVRECEMIAMARSRGLFTMAYVRSPEESAQMTDAGVDVIVAHMGFTSGGDIGAAYPIGLDEAIGKVEAIFDAALKIKSDVLLFTHGGPIAGPTEVEYVNQRTRAVGFVAASSFERIPIEKALKATCDAFKSVGIGR